MNEQTYFLDFPFFHLWCRITAGQLIPWWQEYLLCVKNFMLTISQNP